MNLKVNSSAIYLYAKPGPNDDNGAIAYDNLENNVKQLPKDLKEDKSVKSLTITLTYYINTDLDASDASNLGKVLKMPIKTLKSICKVKV